MEVTGMRVKTRIAAIAGVATLVPAATIFLGAQPAFAEACAGDFCAQFTYINGNVATVQLFNNDSWYGHFLLQFPNHNHANSPDQWNYGGTTYNFSDQNGGTGNWCITNYYYYGPGDYGYGNYECISD
jgi:hypothetical protein